MINIFRRHKLRESDFIRQADGSLRRVHAAGRCLGASCPIHRPSDHPLRDAPLQWRGDRGFMERICPCQIGHPDPDDLRVKNFPEKFSVHGCCGHCGG